MHCEEAIEGEYLAEIFSAMVDVEAVGRKRFFSSASYVLFFSVFVRSRSTIRLGRSLNEAIATPKAANKDLREAGGFLLLRVESLYSFRAWL